MKLLQYPQIALRSLERDFVSPCAREKSFTRISLRPLVFGFVMVCCAVSVKAQGDQFSVSGY